MKNLLNLIFDGKTPRISQKFGENPALYEKFDMIGHNGIDVAVKTGTKIFSPILGIVTGTGNDVFGYGNFIKIKNFNREIIFGHLSEILVKKGEIVHTYKLLGKTGNTGNSTGPHLHFGVRPKGYDKSNGYFGFVDPITIKWTTFNKK